ncbi:MAG: response regulator [Syntrophobacteraceae bacterium]|jgi:DNA-binding NtrC family response regulator
MAHTVLLVDDGPLVLDGLRRALHKEAYEALSAVSADEALRILSRKKVDVVVSDEMMPGMPGSDFLGVVCNKYPEAIRIMLTGRPNLDTALPSINKGHVYRFLIKPRSGMELCMSIKQAIQQRDLSGKSLPLLQSVPRRSTILEQLENQHPGITKVNRGKDGAINISYSEWSPPNGRHSNKALDSVCGRRSAFS